MKLYFNLLFILISLSSYKIKAQRLRPLFTEQELKLVRKLKEKSLLETRASNAQARLVANSLAPFKATIEMDKKDYTKYLKKIDGHYFDQIERTLLYKDLFEKFLQNE